MIQTPSPALLSFSPTHPSDAGFLACMDRGMQPGKAATRSSLRVLCFLALAFGLLATHVEGASLTVNSTRHGTDANGATTTLVEAIQQANAAGAGPHTINLPAVTVFTSDDTLFIDGTSAGRTMYPAITTNITILGNGSTLDATGKNARFFY
ncbi:MAG: hypothetical protein ABL974_22905, partial [Prosthecobacter sp.]